MEVVEGNNIFVIIYDYVGPWRAVARQTREGAVRQWRDSLPVAERAILDAKLAILDVVRDLELLPGFIAGPIKVKGRRFPHIFKIQAGGKIRLRPLFCRGPLEVETELTLLVGATERDSRFEPFTAPDLAVMRRNEVIANEKCRQGYDFPG